ncbi:MAG TPA: HlyD family efflux transporter periplasmic adaptor subunit [Thermoanaerobaculia bacterium]
MTRDTRRNRFLAVLGILLAAGLFGLWAFSGHPGRPGRGTAASEDEWAEVHREDLVVGVEVAGTLTAVDSALLGPPQISDMWNYKISFMAPEGIVARPGQPVLGFDTSELESKLQETMAERDSAEKELEKRLTNQQISRGEDEMRLAEAKAKQRKATLKVDVPPELVASKELAQTRADLDLANREVSYLEQRIKLQQAEAEAEVGALRDKRDRAAARVREGEDAIHRMTVTAPRGGTVIYVSDPRREREKKKVGDSVWRGEKVIEIPDLRQLSGDGQVDEADAGRVTAGQRVTFRLDAHPDVIYTGSVRSLRGAVQARSQNDPVKVVGLDIALDQTDPQRMRPGMRFSGTVEIERAPRTLVVPAETVFNQTEGPVVYRRTGWGFTTVHPVLGRRNARWVEIRSGLSAGDRVARRDLGAEGTTP